MSDDPDNKASDAEGLKSESRPDRDATIEQLERAVASEREHSASLRSTVNELKFQAEILEKSYSKQLEDARARAEASDDKIKEQLVRITELDGAREDAIELLTDAKAEIDRLEAERDQLRRKLAAMEGTPIEEFDVDDDYSGEDGTINALMNDAKWRREHKLDEKERSKAEAEARAAEEASQEEMISPDVVFTAKAADS